MQTVFFEKNKKSLTVQRASYFFQGPGKITCFNMLEELQNKYIDKSEIYILKTNLPAVRLSDLER